MLNTNLNANQLAQITIWLINQNLLPCNQDQWSTKTNTYKIRYLNTITKLMEQKLQKEIKVLKDKIITKIDLIKNLELGLEKSNITVLKIKLHSPKQKDKATNMFAKTLTTYLLKHKEIIDTEVSLGKLQALVKKQISFYNMIFTKPIGEENADREALEIAILTEAIEKIRPSKDIRVKRQKTQMLDLLARKKAHQKINNFAEKLRVKQKLASKNEREVSAIKTWLYDYNKFAISVKPKKIKTKKGKRVPSPENKTLFQLKTMFDQEYKEAHLKEKEQLEVEKRVDKDLQEFRNKLREQEKRREVLRDKAEVKLDKEKELNQQKEFLLELRDHLNAEFATMKKEEDVSVKTLKSQIEQDFLMIKTQPLIKPKVKIRKAK